MGPHGAGLDRLDGVVHVVRGAGGAGQVVDLIHLYILETQRVEYILNIQ